MLGKLGTKAHKPKVFFSSAPTKSAFTNRKNNTHEPGKGRCTFTAYTNSMTKNLETCELLHSSSMVTLKPICSNLKISSLDGTDTL